MVIDRGSQSTIASCPSDPSLGTPLPHPGREHAQDLLRVPECLRGGRGTGSVTQRCLKMVLAKFRNGVSRDPVGPVGYTHTQRETLQYSGAFGGTVSSLPSCPAGPIFCSAHQFPCSFLCLELAPIGVWGTGTCSGSLSSSSHSQKWISVPLDLKVRAMPPAPTRAGRGGCSEDSP